MMEEFRKDGRPVWPRRNAQRRPQQHQQYIELLVSKLDELERKTRPSGGDETAVGKDLAALQALTFASDLVEALAGWAIDHQVGLGLNRLEFVPLGASETKALPEYKAARQLVDQHHYEREGSYLDTIPAPGVARQILRNLLLPNAGACPSSLNQALLDCLEALEWGEVRPLLQKVNSGSASIRLTEIRCQMEALKYVEYQRGAGKKKFAAQVEAADAFGVSNETIRTWEKRVRQELGNLKVHRLLAYARNAGTYPRSSDLGARFAEQFAYGLGKAATEYKRSKTRAKS